LNNGKIVIFTCNWNGYSGLETAGKSRLGYLPDIRPVRVSCLGRLHPGIILKAFAHGAAGVMMLGCPPDACHYDFGSRSAEAVYDQSKDLLHLLGIQESRLALDTLSAGDAEAFIEKVENFIRACPPPAESTEANPDYDNA
jgi:coenzyme F420-reducing hydrogenase delta subunit